MIMMNIMTMIIMVVVVVMMMMMTANLCQEKYVCTAVHINEKHIKSHKT
jgi:uncharacterized membrane protein